MKKASRRVEPESRRRRVNLTVRAALLTEARAQALNLSRFFEEKLTEALRSGAAKRWLEENKEAIEYHRRRIEKHGMWNKDLISF